MKELFRYIYKNKVVSVLLKLFLIAVLLYLTCLLLLYTLKNQIPDILFVGLLYIGFFSSFALAGFLLLLIIAVIFRIVRYKIIEKPCGGVPEHRILDME